MGQTPPFRIRKRLFLPVLPKVTTNYILLLMLIMIMIMMKDCKPATLPDLPLAFVTNLQYNVGSKYQIIVTVIISLSLHHHSYLCHISLYHNIP